MKYIRLKGIRIKNYRSFGEQQDFIFPNSDYKKPISIIGYNNSGKSNLLNAILYGLQVTFVGKDTFTINDFHNRNILNVPEFTLGVESSSEKKFDGEKLASLNGYHRLKIFIDGSEVEGSKIESLNKLELNLYGKEDINYQAFGATKYFNIFYINFHNIKEEISTQKTSWGNLKSFLGKHLQKIVDSDTEMNQKKNDFEATVNTATSKVLEESKLQSFIELIRKNYSTNLRNDNCVVEFGLPNYEDIFLKMLFKIGLNGNTENLIPIDHFGDGFISMFVMAVIQSIAESNTEDKCLFLFEEPESFLHENHQEYFYKSVLCGLAEKGHQVIYTTHSDKMIDPFDTKGLIRLEMDEHNQTVKKYNDVGEFNYEQVDVETGELINYSKFNEFIKTIEPNLNRILFSKKVILVEGPNDVLVYKFAISKTVLESFQHDENITDKIKYADTFLNFENISIVCHHGKTTALYLIELCKHFEVDYFVINDWDFEQDDLNIDMINDFDSLEELKKDSVYKSSSKKAMITNNWNLLKTAEREKIHFNIKKLEDVIGYSLDDKSSLGIWNILNSDGFIITENLFPDKLKLFLGLTTNIEPLNNEEDDLPT
jgi:putative ATP-dependent endonuclease of the OLD family